MTQIIRNGAVVDNDMVRLSDEAAVPDSGCVAVSLQRWLEQAETLRGASAEIAVALPNTADVLEIWPQIADRQRLVLEFPAFADGRAYSQATLLRDRCGFTGELRASGLAVVRDQMQSLARVGFDAYELRDDQEPQACLQAIADFSLVYQPSVDARLPVWQQRRCPTGCWHTG